MIYEHHLKCNIGVPDVYNNENFRIASLTQEYEINNVDLITFLNNVGVFKRVTNNYLEAYSNVVYANIDNTINDATSMGLNTVYYMYMSSNNKVLAKLQGNIGEQAAPVISDLDIRRTTGTANIRVTANVTNTIDFTYHVILTQTKNLDLIPIIPSLSGNVGDANRITLIDTTFTEPYEKDQFPFLQYGVPYYASVYAINAHGQASVESIELGNIGSNYDIVLTELLCDNMGNIEANIVLNINFTASHNTLDYYALAFSSSDENYYDSYTNRDIYTNDNNITGNTSGDSNVSFTMTSDHTGNIFAIDNYVRVAILLVDQTTYQFSGTANVLDMSISLPVIDAGTYFAYPNIA